jgi:DNA-binding FadR family transcriptional regulator
VKQYTKDHMAIINAAIARNPQLARENMEKHLYNVRGILMDFLEKFPGM